MQKCSVEKTHWRQIKEQQYLHMDPKKAIMKREPNFENHGCNSLFPSGIIVN